MKNKQNWTKTRLKRTTRSSSRVWRPTYFSQRRCNSKVCLSTGARLIPRTPISSSLFVVWRIWYTIYKLFLVLDRIRYKTSQYIYIVKMILQMKHYFNNCRSAPPICYKLDATVGNKQTPKGWHHDPTGWIPKNIYIYFSVLKTGKVEALMRFLTLTHNIIKYQIFTYGTQM